MKSPHRYYIFSHLILALLINSISALKHHLVLRNDHRYFFSVSSFGYLEGGRLDVIVQNITLNPDPNEDDPSHPHFGFILAKSDAMRNPAMMNFGYGDNSCLLHKAGTYFDFEFMTMSILPNENKAAIKCTSDSIFPSIRPLPHDSRKDDPSHASYIHNRNTRAATQIEKNKSSDSPLEEPLMMDVSVPEISRRSGKNKRLMQTCRKSSEYLPLMKVLNEAGNVAYSLNFTMFIRDKTEEGFYYLIFNNCRGLKVPLTQMDNNPYTITRFDLSMLIYETNYPENYLSAGSIPLPQMYFVLSVMYFLIGCVWVNFVSRQKENTIAIHRLMTVLVFAKAASLLFHGINYHYIAIDGQPVVTWAYLYYATRFVKGALFFLTLILIGTGWSFIKHILSDKDRNIIIAVVALQVVAHIAEIILDESTEGEASNEFWAELCSMVDLFSCVAILIAISWSVRHLEEASRTDGKAAVNLKRLELFKRFYIISTIYIYITRIITFLFQSMLSYKYSWLAALVSEMATLIYYIVTGCYFQPMPTNPYLLLSTENDQEEDILFSVDSHDSSATQMNALLDDEGRQLRQTRRLIEEDV